MKYRNILRSIVSKTYIRCKVTRLKLLFFILIILLIYVTYGNYYWIYIIIPKNVITYIHQPFLCRCELSRLPPHINLTTHEISKAIDPETGKSTKSFIELRHPNLNLDFWLTHEEKCNLIPLINT